MESRESYNPKSQVNMQEVKDKFIEKLVDELCDVNQQRLENDNSTNFLDICSMVAPIDQHILECEEFMQDISQHNYSLSRFKNGQDKKYDIGEIIVYIENADYTYCIKFHEECYFDSNPAFKIIKQRLQGDYAWDDEIQDYTEYEKEFNSKLYNKNREVEECRKQAKIQSIEKQIAQLQEELRAVKE